MGWGGQAVVGRDRALVSQPARVPFGRESMCLQVGPFEQGLQTESDEFFWKPHCGSCLNFDL